MGLGLETTLSIMPDDLKRWYYQKPKKDCAQVSLYYGNNLGGFSLKTIQADDNRGKLNQM